MYWRRIWRAALLLYRLGRRYAGNLTADEWREFGALVRKGLTGRSKRSPWNNLSEKERQRVRALVTKVMKGRRR
jgi:hypothetical protein